MNYRNGMDTLQKLPDSQERLIIVTGRYLGEGFDDPRLDTLFLAMPIPWQGTLAQYAGRLNRSHEDKNDVVIIDYVDSQVPTLARISQKRTRGCKNPGYEFIPKPPWAT
jgi:superfamily II DNA or RNA helicase